MENENIETTETENTSDSETTETTETTETIETTDTTVTDSEDVATVTVATYDDTVLLSTINVTNNYLYLILVVFLSFLAIYVFRGLRNKIISLGV